MAETVAMPKLGFDMAEGTLVRWLKQVGEAVSKGEILAEIETDKATVEVESPYNGVVGQLLVDQGAVVPVGEPIAIVTAPGESIEESKGGKTEPVPQSPVESDTEPRVEPKEKEQETQGEKPPTPEQASKPETPVSEEGISDRQPDIEPQGKTEIEAPQLGVEAPASPLARRLAQEKGIDLAQVEGSGPGGRIVRKDIEAVLQEPHPQKATGPQAEPAKISPQPALPVVEARQFPSLSGLNIPQDESIPLTRLRAAIGRRMVDSRQQVPDFYVTYEYDVEDLMALRKQVNASLPEDQKISVNDFIVKAVALALRRFPNLNATLKEGAILRHGHIHIGVAVATEAGLLTVVSRDADQKPLRMISGELKEMTSRASAGKVRPDDIEGSTFSTSNLGMFGVEDFVAIINPPEAAILAIGAARQVPVVVNGQIQARNRMRATISADHRVTDGAEAARFMQALAEYLEKPFLLLL